MKWASVIALAVFELIALVTMIFLWRRQDLWWVTKLFWTLVLFVTVLGLLLYGFLSTNPIPHSDEPIDTIGAGGGANLQS